MANQRAADNPSGGIYYGWFIVVAAFFAFGVVYGTVTYSFSVFVNPIAKSFGVTPTRVLFGFTITNIGTGLLGILAGRFLIRFRIRKGLFAGLAVMAIGFLALSAIQSLWQLYAVYGVIIAFGSIVVAPLGASSIVANWFNANRGRALTMATLGTSFGQLLLPRLAAYIIDGWGWQTAYRVFALLMVAVMPVIVLIAIDRPEDKGLLPYGGSVDQVNAAAAEPALLTNRQILRRFDFWTVGLSYVLTVTVYLALVAVMVPYARTYGVSALEASEMTVTMGAFAIVGKIAFATWTDRMGLRNTFWVAIGLNFTACLLLVAVPGYAVLFAASALVGGSAGGVLPLWPGMIAFRFGRNALPQVMGLMSPMVLIVQGFGAPFATAMHFRPAYVVFLVMLIGSIILSYRLNRTPETGQAL
jgi:MFS family permease